MAFELLTVLVVGFAAAGVALFARRILRLGLPRYAVPLAAALAMIGYTVWLRYSWADRSLVNFPPNWVLVETYPYEGFFEPWTAVFPRTDRLLVLDRSQTLQNPDFPRIHLVTLFLLEQHADTLFLRRFIDCGLGRHAPAVFDRDGLPPDDAWTDGRNPPALFAAVCGGGNPS